MNNFFLAAGTIAILFGVVKTAQAAQNDRLDFSVATKARKNAPAIVATASVELSFNLPVQKKSEPEIPNKPKTLAVISPAVSDDTSTLFEGGTYSLVARIVGHAEGTRTAEGHRTRAYYGHVDPGNGVWNLGSFSYQHCNSLCTPEEADDRQLQRLRNQTALLQQRAAAYGLSLSLEAKLNGIDLANQAPLAALDRGGYRSPGCCLPTWANWLRCSTVGTNLLFCESQNSGMGCAWAGKYV